MNKILFVVDMPPTEQGVISSVHMNVASAWLQFEDKSRSIKLPSSDSKQLSRNVWLLDAKNALPFLLELSALAGTYDLPYSAHLLDGDVIQMTSPPSKSNPKGWDDSVPTNKRGIV